MLTYVIRGISVCSQINMNMNACLHHSMHKSVDKIININDISINGNSFAILCIVIIMNTIMNIKLK